MVQEEFAESKIAEILKWGAKSDIPLAKQILTRYEQQIAQGDWSGVEKELFGIYPYYLSLPSIQRVLHEIRDPRAVGKPPAPRATKPKRVKRAGPAKDQPDATVVVQPAAPSAEVPPAAPPPAAPPAAPGRKASPFRKPDETI